EAFHVHAADEAGWGGLQRNLMAADGLGAVLAGKMRKKRKGETGHLFSGSQETVEIHRRFPTALCTIDEIWVAQRLLSPHPGLLPEGEGELGSVSVAYQCLWVSTSVSVPS